jgi:hypothetical protein
MSQRRLVLAVVVSSVLLFACGGSPSAPSGNAASAGTLAAFVVAGVAQADSGSVDGVSHTGAPPAAAGGPSATVTSSPEAIIGGQNLLTVQASAPVQTVYLSVVSSAAVTSAKAIPLLSPLIRALVAPVMAATPPTGFMQFTLSSPATVIPVAVHYPMTLPTGSFTFGVQVAGAGAPGPVATVDKTPAVAVVELLGIVYGHWIGTARTPGERPDPVAGATVSTSLDSRTAVSDANGLFDLKTNTATASCFTITVSAPGLPSYSAQRRFGSDAIVAYTLGSSPQYPIPSGCVVG